MSATLYHVKDGLSGVILLFALGMSLLLIGCETEGASLFDPNYDPGTPAQIDSISPEDSAEAGSVIVITGSNFATTPEDNFVFFNADLATVQQASETELEVQTPDIAADNIEIKIAKAEVEDFSNSVTYRLVAAD